MSLDSRKKMLERIRAMLNTEGRTEAEMMAFLAKARELMATYEVTEADLAEFEQEKATIFKTAAQDPYNIKGQLYMSVGSFTHCLGFRHTDRVPSFVGLESDVIFATWLLDTLQRFIMRALREYQKRRSLKKMTNSNYTSASFVAGCTTRIEEKLKELTVPLPAKNKEMIKAELKKNGIAVRSTSSRQEVHQGSAIAGAKAGDGARFDKPVGSGGRLRLK